VDRICAQFRGANKLWMRKRKNWCRCFGGRWQPHRSASSIHSVSLALVGVEASKLYRLEPLAGQEQS